MNCIPVNMKKRPLPEFWPDCKNTHDTNRFHGCFHPYTIQIQNPSNISYITQEAIRQDSIIAVAQNEFFDIMKNKDYIDPTLIFFVLLC